MIANVGLNFPTKLFGKSEQEKSSPPQLVFIIWQFSSHH